MKFITLYSIGIIDPFIKETKKKNFEPKRMHLKLSFTCEERNENSMFNYIVIMILTDFRVLCKYDDEKCFATETELPIDNFLKQVVIDHLCVTFIFYIEIWR